MYKGTLFASLAYYRFVMKVERMYEMKSMHEKQKLSSNFIIKSASDFIEEIKNKK